MTFSRDFFNSKVDLLGPLLESLEKVFISYIFPNERIWILETSGKFFANLSLKL